MIISQVSYRTNGPLVLIVLLHIPHPYLVLSQNLSLAFQNLYLDTDDIPHCNQMGPYIEHQME